jgi:hypothetical protein
LLIGLFDKVALGILERRWRMWAEEYILDGKSKAGVDGL